MICQSCGKNPATMRVKAIINGELSEYALCPHCARKMGYGTVFFGILDSIFSRDAEEDVVRCRFCGASFDDILRSGKVGCEECYHTFYDRRQPLIRQVHGNTKHRGKVPGTNLPQIRQENQLLVMRDKLRQAIDEENFEHAATLRDQIKELEGKVKGNE